MSDISIEVRGLDEVVKKFGAGSLPIIRALTRGIAEELKSHLAHYPGPVKLPFQFGSRRSQAYYFAKRRRAGLGPYVRNSDPFSQRLGPSWATEHRGAADAAVGTRVTYAPWVQDAKRQIAGHKNTGWVTDEEAIKKMRQSRAAERLLDDIVSKW